MKTTAFWTYVGEALKLAREDADLEPKDIYTPLEQNHRSGVSRWEKKQSWPRTPNPDRILAAYSRETGKSVIDLWEEAVRLARRDEELEKLRTTLVKLGPPRREVEKDARQAPKGPAEDQNEQPSG